MTTARHYTPMPSTWFMQRAGYRRFMAREATAVAIAAYLVYLLILLHRISQGPNAYMELITITRMPVSVTLNSLVFGAVLFHAFTWFNLTPKIMPMYVAEERVSDFWAAIFMGYIPWFAVTAVVLWGVLRS